MKKTARISYISAAYNTILFFEPMLAEIDIHLLKMNINQGFSLGYAPT
jgi:hypothetical protein